MRIKVDTTLCTGHAMCAAMAPEIYILDDFGNCAADGMQVPADMEEAARAGELACPERAIRLVSDE